MRRDFQIFVLVAFNLSCAASPNAKVSSTERVDVTPPVKAAPHLKPCRLGTVSEDVSQVTFQELLGNPEPYYGQRVRMRGYFILALENTALLEPVRRQESVLVNVKKLPVDNSEQLVACRSSAVEIQGYVTHVPHRGKEQLMIFAEAMVGREQ